MYIQERNRILDLLTTVIEAIEYSRKNKDRANNYLQDCLLALNEICKYLELYAPEFESESLSFAKKSLENAKEAKDIAELGRWLKKSQKYVKNIRTKIKENINVRIQILFLPYKASMWTSFHSIWKVASEDPNCDCIVMPIPYYELDSCGNPKKYCYDKDGYPKNVPITHFNDYDITTKRPDIIFIHNPYDGTNNLTRIDSKYFSANLRKHTNMLVYSPYYTLRYYNPEKKIFLCMSPATIYSHKILVQSERLKEIYIEHGHNPNKLLTLGSPKIDSVIENMHNPPEIPSQWQDKINDKYVFLINTHISFFPKYGEKAFEKINNIINYFIKRDDCVAIWRPHPLTETMLKNRFPQYLEKYKKLIRDVESYSNGIIDTFPDYSYSFSVSSAMFSTYSSLITEYMVTGRPVYILEKRNKDELNKISPVDYSFNYYYKEGEYDNEKFTDMVVRGDDPFYEERMKMIKKAFVNSCDGSCGEKVFRYLKKELLK